MSDRLKIACLSAGLIAGLFLIIVLCDNFVTEHIGWIGIVSFMMVIASLFLKNSPRYTLLGWSLLWAFLFYLILFIGFIILLLSCGSGC